MEDISKDGSFRAEICKERIVAVQMFGMLSVRWDLAYLIFQVLRRIRAFRLSSDLLVLKCHNS